MSRLFFSPQKLRHEHDCFSNRHYRSFKQTIGQIASDLPGATAIFRRLKLDFCCGGQKSLFFAAKEKSIDIASLVTELGTLQRQSTNDASSLPTDQLIDLIVSRFHETHRKQLPELVRMALRVEAVHREHSDVPKGLAAFLEETAAELVSHMAKEEQILFPMMKRGGSPMIEAPIDVMRHEHVSHGDRLETLSRITNNFTPPVSACNTWRALFNGLAALHNDLIEHVHIENNALFPRFESPLAMSSEGGGCATRARR
jgi:regulator of cell morphogenesis and NO signaling